MKTFPFCSKGTENLNPSNIIVNVSVDKEDVIKLLWDDFTKLNYET